MKKRYHFILLIFILIQSSFSNFLKAQSAINWDSLASGTKGNMPTVKALKVNDTSNRVYAGGDFTIAGGINAMRIAVWNDTNWDSLGSGTNKEVCALTLYNGKLYAGGKFDSAGRIATNHIACWNSVKWDSLLGGVNGNVYTLCVFDSVLYVGGSFTIANGIKANRIAKWNGSTWDSVGCGFDSTVFALMVFNDTLYAGGSFTKSNGKPVNYIAKWDGTKWDSIGTGMNNTVYALDTFILGTFSFLPTGLYIGGAFTTAGGINANHIAAWIPTIGWDSLGAGTNDTVRAMDFEQSPIVSRLESGNHQNQTPTYNSLIVGGKFTKAGKFSTPYISLWSQFGWDTVGYVNKPVYAVASNRSFLFNPTAYVGGDFDTATNMSTPNYVHYIPPPIKANHVAQMNFQIGSGINELSNKSEISVYPNPSNGVFTVETKNEKLTTKNVIEVYNMLGQEIYSSEFSTFNSQFSINLSKQPSGIYMCRVLTENGDFVGSEKLIIQK